MFEEITEKQKAIKDKYELIEDKMNERSRLICSKLQTNSSEIIEKIEDKEITLRKDSRQSEYEKKRRLIKTRYATKTNSIYNFNSVCLGQEFLNKCQSFEPKFEDIQKYLQSFLNSNLNSGSNSNITNNTTNTNNTSNNEEKYFSLMCLRKLSYFNLDKNNMFKDIIYETFVVNLIKVLDRESNIPLIINESLWILINITSLNKKEMQFDVLELLLKKKGLNKIIDLINSEYNEIQSQVYYLYKFIRQYGVLVILSLTIEIFEKWLLSFKL